MFDNYKNSLKIYFRCFLIFKFFFRLNLVLRFSLYGDLELFVIEENFLLEVVVSELER